MAEINGLRVLVTDAAERGTIHVIQPPPNPSSFPGQLAYERAYEEWWRKVHCWTATIKNIGDDNASE